MSERDLQRIEVLTDVLAGSRTQRRQPFWRSVSGRSIVCWRSMKTACAAAFAQQCPEFVNVRVARHSPTTYETLSAPRDITRCVEPSLVVRARRAMPVPGTPWSQPRAEAR
jgi:hypothetical protein